jgi:glycosyltransferase involved in cell wall biosynthesis
MAKQIIIGVDIRDLRIAKTGAGTYLSELCNQFRQKDPRFKFYFLDTASRVYTGKNKLLKLTEQLKFIVWKQFSLPVKALCNKCDIVFCTDYFVPFFHPGFITIPVFHDAFFWEYPEHYNNYWLFLFKNLGVRAAKRSPFIITPSLYTQEKISLFSGIPKEKIVSIYEAPKSFLTHPVSVEKVIGEYPVLSQPFLLHVGTLEKRKNLPLLIKAFAKLTSNGYPDLKLVLIGQSSPKKDMDDTREIKELIQQNELQSRVILPGYMEDEILRLFYQKALMYIFPSLNEGFGIPVLEAFKNKLPLIISDNSCLPEIAEKAALTFNPFKADELYDTMKKVMENPGLRKDLVEKGSKRLSVFSWEKTAEEIKSIFIRSMQCCN